MQQRHIWISWLWRVHAEGGMIIRWEMVNCKCRGSCLVTPLLPRPPAKLAQPHLTHCSRRHIFYLWDDSDDQVIKTQSCIGWSVEKTKMADICLVKQSEKESFSSTNPNFAMWRHLAECRYNSLLLSALTATLLPNIFALLCNRDPGQCHTSTYLSESRPAQNICLL